MSPRLVQHLRQSRKWMESYTLTPTNLENFFRAFILESDSIDRLLVSPGRKLLGLERINTAFQATTTWCRALVEQAFIKNANDVCSMTVLAEGIGHNLPAALANALAPEHQRGDNFMGVSRFALAKYENDAPRSNDFNRSSSMTNQFVTTLLFAEPHHAYIPFDARVKYLRVESPAPVWVMLDTIATGATLVRGLEAAFANAPKPREILLGTPAGSLVGAKKIAALCARENVSLTFFFFGAIFGLWKDGTALPWCHPDTIFSGTPRSEKNRALTARLFNNIDGFCSVGDCSANFFDVVEAEKILQEEETRFNWQIPVSNL